MVKQSISTSSYSIYGGIGQLSLQSFLLHCSKILEELYCEVLSILFAHPDRGCGALTQFYAEIVNLSIRLSKVLLSAKSCLSFNLSFHIFLGALLEVAFLANVALI